MTAMMFSRGFHTEYVVIESRREVVLICQNNVAKAKSAGSLSSSGDKGKELTVNKCMGEAPLV